MASASTPSSDEGSETGVLVQVRLNGRPAPMGTRLWVFPPGKREDPIRSGWPDEPLPLPPGTWDLVAELPINALEPIRAWQDGVEVKPGQLQPITLDVIQKVGAIRARVVSGKEDVPEASLVLLPNGERATPQGALSPEVAATLPPGKYTVGARLESSAGTIAGYVDNVEVEADEIADVTVDIGPTGHLEVRVKGQSYGTGVIAGLVPEGRLRPVGYLMAFAPDRVPAGTWDLRLEKQGMIRQVWWFRGVVVKEGETTVVEVPGPPIGGR